MDTAPHYILMNLCLATLLSGMLPWTDAACAQSSAHARNTDAWSSLRTGTPQGNLWRKGLSPEELARRVQNQPAQTKPQARQRKAPAAQAAVPTRRKSPPPTWRGDTPEQREAIRARSCVPERNLTPQRVDSKPLPIDGMVEDRSSSWHANPNRPNDAGETVFADRRQTISGMVGYSDSRVSFGVGPEITIDDGQRAASLMRGSGAGGGGAGSISSASAGSPASAGNAEGTGGKGDHKEKSGPPPVDVGVGMRLRIGF